MYAKFAFLSSLLALCASLSAQPGSPDPSFGKAGFVTTNVYRSDDQAFGALRRPDGRLLIVGSATLDSTKAFSAVQLLPDGNPDPAFDLDGLMIRSLGPDEETAYAVAAYPDGRTVLAGIASSGINENDFALLRLLPNGARDASFGANGQVRTDFDGGDDFVDAVMIQPDGKVIVAGSTAPPQGEADLALARYLPDGQPDSSFGTNGKVVFSRSVYSDVTFDALLQPDGKILVAGQLYYDIFTADFLAARFLPNGQPDSSFGDNGYRTIDFDAFNDLCRGVTLQPDGKIVLAGFSVYDDFIARVTATRLLPDGAIDTSFGLQGKVIRDIGLFSSLGTDVQVQYDGKILISGMTEDIDARDFFVLRLLADGSSDPDFADQGLFLVSVSDKDDNSYALVPEPDGSMTLVGRSENKTEWDIAVLRIRENGTLDPGFQQNGVLRIDQGNSYDDANDLLVHADGRLKMAGFAYNDPSFSGNVNAALAARLPDGSPDLSFGQDGFTTVDWSPGLDIWNGLAEQPDQKIITWGTIGQQPGLGRFLPDGKPDSTFGSAGRVLINAGPYGNFNTVLLLPDGKFLAAGYPGQIQVQNLLMRFLPNGDPDTSFGLNGVAPDLFPQGITTWNHLLRTSDGKILAIGLWDCCDTVVSGGFFLARLFPDGTPDPEFGTQGYYLSPGNPPSYTYSYKMALQSDGKILLAGTTSHPTVIRLLPDGTPDPDFGSNGVFELPTAGPLNSRFLDILVQPDGRIIAAGWDQSGSGAYNGDPFIVARIDPNGVLDATFADNGVFHYPAQAARALGLQPDGSIVVAGSIPQGSNRNDLFLVRLITGPVLGVADRPEAYPTLLAYPNPVVESLQLEYELLEDRQVSIRVFDLNGRLLSTPLQQVHRPAGPYREQIQLPQGLPAGRYHLVFETGVERKTLVFVKGQ